MELQGRPNIGGMEKAFSTNVMMRIVEYLAGRTMINISLPKRKAAATTKQRRKRKKICRRSGKEDWGAWDILPNELLVSVLMKLSVFDYLSFSGVCRSWRSASINIRKYIMDRQQPLVVVRPKYSKKACVLYNIFDGKSCKAMLPDLPCKSFVGLSCGYLITIDKNMGFWLVNLMTRHELHFPSLPESMVPRESIVFPQAVSGIINFDIHAVLFQSTKLSRVFMVLFSRNYNFLLLCESGSGSWQKYFLPNTSAGISDVKILDSRFFVLTCDAHLGEFNPMADPFLKLYNINIPVQLRSHMYLQLVTSESKIYTILCYHLPPFYTEVQYLSFYELDYKMKSVKQIHDLGSKSLFLNRYNSAVVDTTEWGAGNCVCVLQSYWGECRFFHINGNELATVPIVWDSFHLYGDEQPYFWYFPSESWDISCVGDEFGT